MILPSDSIIRNPPKRLAPKQIVALNAIRYSVDICEVSYQRLIKNLDEIAKKAGYIEYLDFPEIFCDVWSIINNSVLFKKIICKHFGMPLDHCTLSETTIAEGLRNTNQHIEDRIDEVLTTEDLPVYGALSWFTNIPKNNEEMLSLIYSGTITNKRKVRVNLSNQKDENENSHIRRIEFVGVVRKRNKNKQWFFVEEKLLLNRLIYDIVEIVEILQENLLNQVPTLDMEENHVSDLVIQLKGKRV